ncbi:MAG: DnaJ domain-containing protein [Myxococcota bacterium]|nr:DnaJ domain-containing protein [Myxococcota bacterium]
MGDEGSLATHPLPATLLALHRTRFDGVLALTRDKTHKEITFHQGAPLLSESNVQSETLGLQLIDQGIIDGPAHERVSAFMARKECKEGVALLALELLKPKDLFLALKEQVRRRLLEAFAWAEGEYKLTAAGEVKDGVQPLRSDLLALIHEGLANHWTPDRLLADLTLFVERFPVRAKTFDELARRLPEGDEITPLLDAVDGTRSLGVVIGNGFNSVRVLATCWMLANGDFVSFEDHPVGTAGEDEAEQEEAFEIEVVTRETGDDHGPQDTEPTVGDDAANDEPSEATQQMRGEVFALLEDLEDRSLYEMLGVAEDASDGEIRKAYFKAAKRFHPDALNHLGLSSIKHEAARVFARIAEANDVLRDAAKRADYDARRNSDEPMVDTHALAQAETFYRKGEILVRMGDFRGALEYLENAVELWPDECEYQSALGWALYKQPQADAERALGHLEQAVALDDANAVALFRLGMVLRATGDEERGSEAIARAETIDPKVG